MTKHLKALNLYDPEDTFIELYTVRFPELTPRCASNHCKVPNKYLDVNSTKELLESGETLRPETMESILLKDFSKPLD